MENYQKMEKVGEGVYHLRLATATAFSRILYS